MDSQKEYINNRNSEHLPSSMELLSENNSTNNVFSFPLALEIPVDQNLSNNLNKTPISGNWLGNNNHIDSFNNNPLLSQYEHNIDDNYTVNLQRIFEKRRKRREKSAQKNRDYRSQTKDSFDYLKEKISQSNNFEEGSLNKTNQTKVIDLAAREIEQLRSKLIEENFLREELKKLKIALNKEKSNREKNLQELEETRKQLKFGMDVDNESLMLSSFQENQIIIKAKNKRIVYLEEKIVELNKRIGELTVKTIHAYSYLFLERELLQNLISAHLEFNKARLKQSPVIKLRKHKESIYNELEKKLDEETMEKVEIVLADCEELVKLEYELVESKNELSENKEFVEESEKIFLTYINVDKINVEKGNVLLGNKLGDNTNFTYKPTSRKRLINDDRLDNNENKKSREKFNWLSICQEFTESLVKEWEERNFTYWQVKEWISIGLKPSDANFCSWLKKNGWTSEKALNFGDLKQLRKTYQEQISVEVQKDQVYFQEIPPK